MTNTNGPTEKPELSLKTIREIMKPEPTPCRIECHQRASVDEDAEIWGRNTDSARASYVRETGHAP